MAGRIVYRLRALVIGIAIVANVTGALFLFALVVILNADVIARGVLNAPISGVVEVVIFALILVVFLQLPDVVRSGRLTRSDGLLLMLSPRVERRLSTVIDAVAAMFMAMIAWTVWPEVVRSFQSCYFFAQPPFGRPPSGDFLTDLQDAFRRCDYFGTPGILRAPWWPAKLAIFFGVSLSAVIFAFKVILPDRQTRADPLGSIDRET